jgi:hypothetical protein
VSGDARGARPRGEHTFTEQKVRPKKFSTSYFLGVEIISLFN